MGPKEVKVDVRPTPNPNALKFITNYTTKTEGHSTYRTPVESGENDLALKLFMLRGVDQLHFFDNFITVTKFTYEDWEELSPKIVDCLRAYLPSHDPSYYDPDPEKERREALTPELQVIEGIFDRTVRYGLQADGGDIQTVELTDNVLVVRYQGACGTCPSARAGTLEAIRSILREEYAPDIDVVIEGE